MSCRNNIKFLLDYDGIIKRIKSTLDEHGVKATPISYKLGLSSTWFSEINSGKNKPSLYVLSKVSKFFNVSLDYLVFGNVNQDYELPVLAKEDKDFFSEFNKLDPEHKKEVLSFIRALQMIENHTTPENNNADKIAN